MCHFQASTSDKCRCQASTHHHFPFLSFSFLSISFFLYPLFSFHSVSSPLTFPPPPCFSVLFFFQFTLFVCLEKNHYCTVRGTYFCDISPLLCSFFLPFPLFFSLSLCLSVSFFFSLLCFSYPPSLFLLHFPSVIYPALFELTLHECFRLLYLFVFVTLGTSISSLSHG